MEGGEGEDWRLVVFFEDWVYNKELINLLGGVAMGKLGLGLLLGVASFAFAQTTVNPLCSMIEALSANWGIITWLVVGLLAIIVIVSGTVYLVQTKFPFAFAILIGGAVILLAAYRLMDASGKQLSQFANTCKSSQIEVIKPVAKSQ